MERFIVVGLCAFAPPIRHHHSQPPFKVQYRTRDHAILMGGPVCKEYSSDLRVDVLAYTNHLRFKVTCRREYIYIILYASICCLSLYIYSFSQPSHRINIFPSAVLHLRPLSILLIPHPSPCITHPSPPSVHRSQSPPSSPAPIVRARSAWARDGAPAPPMHPAEYSAPTNAPGWLFSSKNTRLLQHHPVLNSIQHNNRIENNPSRRGNLL